MSMNCVFLEFRLAVIQLHVTNVKSDNLCKAKRLIKEAAGQGSKLVVLPVSGGTEPLPRKASVAHYT